MECEVLTIVAKGETKFQISFFYFFLSGLEGERESWGKRRGKKRTGNLLHTKLCGIGNSKRYWIIQVIIQQFCGIRNFTKGFPILCPSTSFCALSATLA